MTRLLRQCIRVGRAAVLRFSPFAMMTVALLGAVVRADAPATAPTIPAVALAAEPLYARGARAKPTLTLALSVEFPTVGAQYLSGVSNDTNDATYSPSNKYIGYFDSESCYVYNDAPAPPSGVAVQDYKRFDRFKGTTTRTCGGDSFSGNFLNWASSSAVDILRYGLSGGDRWIDTATLTVLQRAYLPTTGDNNSGNFWNGTNFPSKQISATLAAGALPTALVGTYTGTVYVANCRNRMHFGTAKTGSCDAPGGNSNLGGPGSSQVGEVKAYPGDAATALSRFGGTQCAVESLASLPYAGYTSSDPSANTTTCSFVGLKTVIYGIGSGAAPSGNGGTGWMIAAAANGIACSSTAFEFDPAPGTYKRCYVRDRIDGDPALGSISPSPAGATPLSSDGYFFARVSVCASDSAGALLDPRPDLCLRYPNGKYKPVGNLQKYSDRVRVAAFGYLNDNTDEAYPRADGTRTQRQGGVLRAPMKYVGPKAFDANFSLISGANPQAEWDESTGVLVANPEGASLEPYSGVINYLNRFGRTGATLGHYKRRDPVSELYYESLRYIQGLPPSSQSIAGVDGSAAGTALKEGFPVYTSWTDPHPAVTGMTDYSCVKNNILTIGDLNTNADLFIPGNNRVTSNDPTRSSSDEANEPDFYYWTKVVGGFESNHEVIYADGKNVSRKTFNPSSFVNGERWGLEDQSWDTGTGYYMAGMAYWANTHDIRGSLWTESAKRRPGMRVTTYMLDVNEFGEQTTPSTHRNNPFFLAAKYGGFKDETGTGNPFKGKKTGAAGESPDPEGNINTDVNWEYPAGSKEAKNYYLSSSAQAVLDALNKIFENVAKEANSIAGGAISTQRLTSVGGFIYQAQFDAADWSGDLVSYPVSVNGVNVNIGETTPAWSAKEKLDVKTPASRNIYVGKSIATSDGAATSFSWSSLDADAQTALRINPDLASGSPLDTVLVGQARVDFLRGLRTAEAPAGTLRKRGAVLGDIVNSGVAYSGQPNLRYSDPAYAAFYSSYKSRSKALFVGANDGMLHAFNADSGEELFAYIPSWLVRKLPALTSTVYKHQSYLDGTPAVGDAKWGGTWKSVLVSGTGGGGQGVFALNVTDPTAFDGTKVLWEFTDRDDADMGNVIGRPQILKFRMDISDATKDKYFAVVASGVNNYVDDGHFSTTGNPTLFLLDLSKVPGVEWQLGTNYYKIGLPASNPEPDSAMPRGIAGFTARVGAADEVTYIYAGDLQGNVWKLDFTRSGASAWSVDQLSYFKNSSAHAIPMFVAKDADGQRQPITMEPALVFGAARTIIVSFATGKFLETSDSAGPYTTQSVYAILDNNSNTPDSSSGLSAISGRARLQQGGSTSAGLVSVGNFVWGRPLSDGDSNSRSGWYFDFPTSSATGERQISGMAILAGKIIFGTVIPAVTSCENGNGNLYVIDVRSGNGGSEKSTVGILGEPFVTQVGDSSTLTVSDSIGRRQQDSRYQVIFQGSSGLSAPGTQSRLIGKRSGRLSWREISNYQDIRKRAVVPMGTGGTGN